MSSLSPVLDFRVLGPLRVLRDGEEVPLNAPMQRKLLLRLLLDFDRPISRDQLQESLWPEAQDDKSSALRFHITKLRDVIDPDRSDLLVTVGSGYRLVVESQQIDAERFVARLDQGLSLIDDDAARALKMIEDALAMWVGSPYGDAEFDDFARPEIRRLEEAHVRANEGRIEAMLRLGLHEDTLMDLERLVREHPLRERLRAQQMLALYRSGRTAEALRAYSDARGTLGEELGIEPSPELAELEEKILLGERELLQTPAPSHGVVTNVPTPNTPLVGRAESLDELTRQLEASHLVTLIGVGGVGKTRLAQAFALERDHGYESVRWVALADSVSESDVLERLLDSVAAIDRAGIEPIESVISHLRDRRALVVLDNCEHVAAVAASVARRIVDSCPGISILVTSRRPLGLKGEAVYRVPHLDTPAVGANLQEIAQSDAVAFLATVADQKGRPVRRDDLEDVASIVRRLEGNPLAIELAVSRLSTLSVADLDRRLSSSLSALGSMTGDESDHRRSMKATMDWSLDLLSNGARNLFQRLGVFAGGANLDAIEAVCTSSEDAVGEIVPQLEELVDASLLEAWDHSSGRRLAIPSTLAGLSDQDLDSSEKHALCAAHAVYYAGLATSAHEGLIDAQQDSVLAEFAIEEPNLRNALSWAREHQPELAIDIARGLGRYWFRVGKHREAREILSEVARESDVAVSEHLCDIFATLSYLSLLNGDLDASRELGARVEAAAQETGAFTALVQVRFTESTRLWAMGDTEGAVAGLIAALDELGSRSVPLAVYMLRALGRRQIQLGAWDRVPGVLGDLRWWAGQGHPAAEAALAEINAGVSYYLGNVHQAEIDATLAVESWRDLSANHELAEALNLESNIALARGDWDRATALAIEALGLARETLIRGVESQSLSILGNALVRAGRSNKARRNLLEAVEIALTAPARVELVWALSFFGAYQSSQGAAESAVSLYTAAEEGRLAMGLEIPANLKTYRQKDLDALRGHLGEERFEQAASSGRDLDIEGELGDLLLA